jgi:hypothetical protein
MVLYIFTFTFLESSGNTKNSEPNGSLAVSMCIGCVYLNS